jgi:hypothetical protein
VKKRIWLSFSFALFLFVGVLFYYLSPVSPRHVYLTWKGDTSRTITVNFHHSQALSQGVVVYDVKSEPHSYQWQASSEMRTWFGGRGIYHIELTGLQPETTYYFKAGNDSGLSEELHFKTPPDSGPVRFVTGGDMGVSDKTAALLVQAAKQKPMFAALGGDLAYANGLPDKLFLWDQWLDLWFETMRTDDGGLVPMVLAVGNHETQETFEQEPGFAPYFDAFFDQALTNYTTKTFSDTLALVVLDSGHTTPMEGRQTRWLDNQLALVSHFPNRFALYHVPLYPSHRPFDMERSVKGRLLWAPLFDKHRLMVAFENHDHAFKRTHPIRAGEVVEEGAGVVYLGDGCFGRAPRNVEPIRWYEARAESRLHFWVVEADHLGATCKAIDIEGEVFDEVRVGGS